MKTLIKDTANWAKRAFLLLIYDVIAVNLASIGALMLRFDFSYSNITDHFLDRLYACMPINTLCTIIVFYMCRMYHSLWLYASVSSKYSDHRCFLMGIIG